MCGNSLNDDDQYCPKCGTKQEASDKGSFFSENTKQEFKSLQNNSDYDELIKVFAIICTVITGFAIIPLLWTIPLTVILCGKLDNHEKVGVGLSVVILLFVSMISGILLLVKEVDNK